jgi:hypothetical protein
MVKIVDEMTAAGSGATIGPIMPLGAGCEVEKEKVDEMIRLSGDLGPGDVVVFLEQAGYFDFEDFNMAGSRRDYRLMADIVRETVARAVIRRNLDEVIRKRDGKWVLYAPNQGKKSRPKQIATFSTKLAAKRAELARFPPKDPEKLARLRKQIEKMLKDPKERAKEITKEIVDRDIFERAVLSSILQNDLRECFLNEGLFRKRRGSKYESFVKSLSKKAVKGDKEYQKFERNLSDVSGDEMVKKLREIGRDLNMTISAGEPKKHVDGKMYLPFSIKCDVEVKPIYLYVEDDRIKVEFGDEAVAALTRCSPESAGAIRSRLAMLGEGPADTNPRIAQVRGERDTHLDKIVSFLDNFLAKLTPLAMTSLKKLLVKKYRKIGVQEQVIREGSTRYEIQVMPDEERIISLAALEVPGLARHLQTRSGMLFVSPEGVQPLLDYLRSQGGSVVQSLIGQLSRRSGLRPAAPQTIPAHSSQVVERQPDLMSPEEFSSIYHQARDYPKNEVRAFVQEPIRGFPGKEVDPREWASELEPITPPAPTPEADRAARVRAQDIAGTAGVHHVGPTQWKVGSAERQGPKGPTLTRMTVLDPTQQERDPEMEDTESWFSDDFNEDVSRMKDLLRTECSFEENSESDGINEARI